MRSLHDLRDEMRAVASGERKVPPAPTRPEANQIVSVLGVLTESNLVLMQLIASERPESVSRLAQLSGRSQPNVSRALQDLAKRGLVRLVRDGLSIRPELAAKEVGIDLERGTCSVIPYTVAAE